MLPDPYLTERLSEEYRKDRLRQAEQARLAREAAGPAPKAMGGWIWVALPVLLAASLWLIR